mmetsp:Transcript_22765/g.54493  ORF Transcript_22765/g.54493 Transcript_22765/m.54493 type:complete len:221 (+) Transcript_22765:641-1303(+)
MLPLRLAADMWRVSIERTTMSPALKSEVCHWTASRAPDPVLGPRSSPSLLPSSVSQPLRVPSCPTSELPYEALSAENSSMRWLPGTTIMEPSSMGQSPSGIHAVRRRLEPFPRKTRSVWTPVNSPGATARSHLKSEVTTSGSWKRFAMSSNSLPLSRTLRTLGMAATCCMPSKPIEPAPSAAFAVYGKEPSSKHSGLTSCSAYNTLFLACATECCLSKPF